MHARLRAKPGRLAYRFTCCRNPASVSFVMTCGQYSSRSYEMNVVFSLTTDAGPSVVRQPDSSGERSERAPQQAVHPHWCPPALRAPERRLRRRLRRGPRTRRARRSVSWRRAHTTGWPLEPGPVPVPHREAQPEPAHTGSIQLRTSGSRTPGGWPGSGSPHRGCARTRPRGASRRSCPSSRRTR